MVEFIADASVVLFSVCLLMPLVVRQLALQFVASPIVTSAK